MNLTGVVGAALDRLPDVLADGRARSALMAVAAALPAELATGPLGLEIRLAGPKVVDLFAAAVPGDEAYLALVRALRSGTGWNDPKRAADLAEVLERWQRRKGPLPLVARYLLVEADAPTGASAVPVPSIFLAPRGAHDSYRPGMPPNAFQARPDVTTMAAAELSGVWPDPATAQALAAVCEVLPDTADIFAVGAMVSRDAGSSMRVAVRRLTPEQTHTVLIAAGRASQADVLAERVAATCAQQQVIAFEVGPGAEHRVGLELSPPWDWKQAEHRGWPELLDEMVRCGFAQPERAAVVPGLIDAGGDPLWGLAHVKIGADDTGMLPGCKLYVGLLHGGRR